MSIDSNKKNDSLRKRAEKNLTGQEESGSETQHELDIHKEELKMQTQELLFAQKKLFKSLGEYTQLFNLAPVGYIVMDQYGKILNLNNTATSLLGLENYKIIGKHFSVFLNGRTFQDDYYRHRNDVLETEEQKKTESEIRQQDGTIVPVLIESALIHDEENNLKHLLAVVMDISERKAYEHRMEKALAKEKELNDLKSRFISMASHEFRTPLSTILTSVDIIDRYIVDHTREKCSKHIARIQHSVSNLTEMLNDLLLLDKLEHGGMKWKKELFNVQENTAFVLDQIKLILKTDQSIDCIYKGHDEFKTDKGIFHSILFNLLSNASKYSGEGKKIELTIKVDDKMKIEVKDHGIGIPFNEQEKIFSRLFRAKNAEMIEGAGLGLNILKKYIELLNGQISFKSDEDKGTIFTVEIPD